MGVLHRLFSMIQRKSCYHEKEATTVLVFFFQFTTTHNNMFYGPLSGTTRVSRYQKKHSPTHHPDQSSSNLYQLLPSTMIHSILLVQITCLAIFLHNLFPCPLWSTSYSIHFFTQSVYTFCSTCPYHCNLFCCSTNIISSIPSLSLNS